MDDRELGQRIAYWRERRGMTQQVFADRIARSKSWVEKVEAGTRSAERLSILEVICEVLRVDLPVLIGRELPRDTDQCLDSAGAETIRAALERYDGISSRHAGADPDPPVPESLRKQLAYMWRAFETADYEVAASTARKVGEFELAWLAGDRGIQAAEQAGDPLLTATAAYRVANALLAMGRTRAAFDLNVSFADRVESMIAGPADFSVYGTLLLQAAIAGARQGDNRGVRDLVREAHAVAEQVGPGRNDYHTAFGPVNVGIHRVSALVELGEGGAAAEAAGRVPPDGLALLPRERRANHYVDVARGYSQWGRGEEALSTLLEAEQLAPAEVRCRPMARAAISDLLQRSHGAAPEPLRELAGRAGVTA